MILPVIMAGGSGTRLWPLSRTHFPKQFHSLVTDTSLLVDTIDRMQTLNHMPPLIICNNDHRFLIAEQLRQHNMDSSGIILEPVGRNTCPAITIAALHAKALGCDPYLLILAADHAIGDINSFIKSIELSILPAKEGKLVTFGIVPSKPETGYGYILKGEALADDSFKVASFKEKPDEITAKKYVESQQYLWNSGMFLFKASVFIEQVKIYRPDIFHSCELALEGSTRDLDFIRLDNKSFIECANQSVDYAIMERTDRAVVIPMDAQWNDVGSWASLWELSEKNTDGNHLRGEVLAFNSTNNYIRTDSSLVATIGIHDLVVVNTKDALLISNRNCTQDVKLVVDKLKIDNRRELAKYPTEYRTWGEIEVIEHNNSYIVNKITVNPGGKISKQVHYHRSEHWIIVSGTAKVELGSEVNILHENESTFIRMGQPHSLSNYSDTPLKIIEIQVGVNIQENDIIRYSENKGEL